MRPIATRPAWRLLFTGAFTASLALTVVAASPASAVFNGTQVFNEPFTSNTVTGAMVAPLIAGGVANGACLTVAGNTTMIPKSCTTGNDPSNGALRLTSATATQAGSVFGQVSAPTSQGFSATFEMHQWNPTGSTFGDGLAFTIAAVDPGNPLAPASTGPTGGSLGYSALRTGGLPGLQHAYLGFGFDVFGNFSNTAYEGSTCTDPPYIGGTGVKVPGQAVVRGPGQGVVGYCALNSTASTTASPKINMHGSTRANSTINVAIAINPTSSDLVDQNGLTIPAGQYIVQFTPIGGTLKTLTGALPTVTPTFYGAGTSSWITAAGIPKQLVFGVTASTGSVTDNHDITNALLYSLTPVPQLTVTQTSYSDPSPAIGAPVTYAVVGGVLAGPAESAPISITATLPSGVKPISAAGSGWVCAAPVGQQITCTDSNAPFPAGANLPPLNVQGIVTTAGLTAAGIATSTVMTSGSADGLPGVSNAATPASPTLPPGTVSAVPSSGPKAGGNSVVISGTNVPSATTIQIGTTAEFNAGTVTALGPCAGNVAAVGCFTTSGSTIVISSMPAHASGAVQVRVVTFGVGGSVTYTYTSSPNAPTVTAVPGITSATASWTVPTDNGGSAITGYQVTPIRDGVRGTTVNVSSSTLTKTFTGLDAEVSYTFEVLATNINGPGSPGVSPAVVPYVLPGAPTGVSGSPGDNSVALTWTAPADNGGAAVSAYVVTPFIGGVAQTPVTTPTAATTYTVTGLTAGTSYTFTVKAVNAAGTGPASAPSGPVVPNAPPHLAFPPPPAGEVSVPYNTTLTVTGGTGPFTWAVASGNLPSGLTLVAGTGAITGSPTTAGSSTALIRVTDANGLSDTQSATIVIAAAPSIGPAVPPAGEVGAPYSFTFNVGGGTGPFTWSVSAGALPLGLSLATNGTLSGTPTAAGSSAVTVRVVDAFGVADTKAVTIVVAGGPVIGTTPPPNGEVGNAYGTTYTVTGGTGPFTWSISAGALPAGLFLDPSTGAVSGVPTAAGTATFTVRVVDALSQAATQASAILVVAAPTLSFPPPPAGEVSVPYSTTLTVSGGVGPYSWTVDSGTLPAGLSLAPVTGVISGTPTTAGPTSFVIRVTDSTGLSDTESATIAITAAPAISSGNPPNGVIGTPYSFPFTVAGGTGPYAWSVSAGTLPGGISLDPVTGVLSGTATASGSKAFTVRVVDSLGVAATKAVTLRIVLHLAISGVPTTAEIGVAYDFPYLLTGGSPPVAWTISVGALPAGLLMNPSTGEVTGVPSAPGAFSFTVRAVDSLSQAATLASSITVVAAPSLSFPPPPGGDIGAPYSTTLTVTGGLAPFTWTVDSGALPAGLTLDAASGVISGTPTTAGSPTALIRVTDANGQTATESVTITIVEEPAITSGAPPVGEVGVPYNFQFTVTGGIAPFTWSVPAGSPPAGLTLDAAGNLTGTPTTPGSRNFTVKVVDANGVSDTRAVDVVIAARPAIDTTPPPGGEVGTAYASSYVVTGGTGPFRWTLSAGALPAGLFLDQNSGAVTGVPSAAGTATFTVRVVDALNQAATLASSITVIAGPQLTFPPPPAGEVSVPYSTTMTASGGTAPYTWSLASGSLPGGLLLSHGTGIVSGTPTAPGTSVAVIRVTDANGQVDTAQATIVITAVPAIGSALPPAGEVGAPYNFGFSVAGGKGPFTWSVSTGTPPAGLTLSPTGALTGAPTAAGSTSFTVQVVDSFGLTDTKAVTVVVSGQPVIGTTPPPNGEVGVAYDTTYTVTGGTGPFTWSVSAGGLPAGLSLDPNTGEVTGVPTTAGTAAFTVHVLDAQQQAATQASAILVVAAPVLTFPPPQDGEVSAPYSTTLTVTGGTGPYVWTIDSGTLPDGLSLAAGTGVVSGTPTTAGTTTATVRVTDAAGLQDTKAATITITAAPVITSANPPNGVIGVPYSFPFTVGGGTAPFAWSVSAGSLPVGLTLNPTTGVLSGTSNVNALSTFTVRVLDAQGVAATKAVTLRIALTLAISGVPPVGEVGVSYAAQYNLTGGTAPFTWSISRLALPAGLFLDPTSGAVTGIPTTAGTFAFTVHVVDSQGQAGNLASSITVVASPSLTIPQPPDGEVSVPYSTTLPVNDGIGPFTWTVESGPLPDGLTLGAASGTISGLPTTGGAFGFNVLVTDSNGRTADQFLVINITAAPVIDSGQPHQGEVGAEYRFFFSATGGEEPYSWSISAGDAPAGLSLDADGTLGGVPTETGTTVFTVQVEDANGVVGTQVISFLVVPPPAIDPTPPPAGEVDVAYSTTYTVIDGTGPFGWSISAGALPDGLSLDGSTGEVSGTPTAPGTSTFTLRVADAQDLVATLDSSITIVPVVALSYPPTSGEQGSPLSVDPTVTGGTGPYTFALTGGSLPSGVTLSLATGRISGTPTEGGVFSPEVTLTDVNGITATTVATLSISVQSTVVLGVSAPLVNLGDVVTLTATVTPGGATGSVAFTVVPSSGPDAGQTVSLGTATLDVDGVAVLVVQASAFGANVYTASYGGDGSHAGAVSAPESVEVAASRGEVIVEEMRLFGPAGLGDTYVQLTNLTSLAVPLSGFTLTGSSGAVVTLPVDAPALQPGQNYLLAGPDFSLGAFATPDLRYAAVLGTGGVKVIAPDTALTVTDAVGSADGFSSGTPLPFVSGPSAVQQAWTRQITFNDVQDTADNAADFNFVSVTGEVISGVQSVLGGPAPAGLGDPGRDNPGFASSLLDTGRLGSEPPNRVVTRGVGGQPGSLVVRRTITNTSGSTITSANLRITSISQLNGRPQPGVPTQPPHKVNLWLVDPDTPTSQITLSNGDTVTVQNLSVTSTHGAAGGGLNSTLDVPLPAGGLAPGQSVSVALTFAVGGSGTFWFSYDGDIH